MVSVGCSSTTILPSSLRGQLPTSLRVPALWLPLCRALCHTSEPSALPGLAALPAWLLLSQGELWQDTQEGNALPSSPGSPLQDAHRGHIISMPGSSPYFGNTLHMASVTHMFAAGSQHGTGHIGDSGPFAVPNYPSCSSCAGSAGAGWGLHSPRAV